MINFGRWSGGSFCSEVGVEIAYQVKQSKQTHNVNSGLDLEPLWLFVLVHYKIMELFWSRCSRGDCIRQYIFLVLNSLALLFCLANCVSTWYNYKKMKFELMPITINTIATVMITFMCLTQENYEYNLVIEIIEIYTYFFFTFSFLVLYLKGVLKLQVNQ